MSLKRVLLIRHGQTDWNIQGRWQGYEPVPLNAEGLQQARALAASLMNRPIGSIYTSDLPRALQTAAAIGEVVGIEPVTDIRLREFHLGIFQGHTREQMIEKFPAEWASFEADYWNYTIPNGESRRMMQDRIYAAWEHIIAEASGPEAVIVTHGGSIRVLLLKLFTDIAEQLDAIHVRNTSLTILEREQDTWQLRELAVVNHLETDAPKTIGEGS